MCTRFLDGKMTEREYRYWEDASPNGTYAFGVAFDACEEGGQPTWMHSGQYSVRHTAASPVRPLPYLVMPTERASR